MHARVSKWTSRLQNECENQDSGLFVTLTYATPHLPFSYRSKERTWLKERIVARYTPIWTIERFTKSGAEERKEGPYRTIYDITRSRETVSYRSVETETKVTLLCKEPTLNDKDVTDFFKRLRINEKRAGNDKKIVYYYSGEYGGKRQRPHYHLIVFNASKEQIIRAWQKDNEPIGHVHFGNVSENSIAYVCKYINKPTNNWNYRDYRMKPFSRMSKGIGINYLRNNDNVRWHKEELRNYLVKKGGFKSPLPRYWKDAIFWMPEEREAIAQAMHDRAVEKAHRLFDEYMERFESIEAARYYMIKDDNESRHISLERAARIGIQRMARWDTN
jgi:hypothetical protein